MVSSFAFISPSLVAGLSLDSQTQLRVNRSTFALETGRKLKIGFISDLHSGFFLSDSILTKVLSELQDYRPDYILIGGDIVDSGPEELKAISWFLNELVRLCPVVSVFGNHDIGPGSNKLGKALTDLGVVVLRDEFYVLSKGLKLFGTRDHVRENPDLTPVLNCSGSDKIIILTHNPDLALRLCNAEQDRIALVLAGHTHGGQIRLPGVGPLINQADPRFQPGICHLGEGSLPVLVTSGIGYAVMTVRINCPSEMHLIDLVPREKTKSA